MTAEEERQGYLMDQLTQNGRETIFMGCRLGQFVIEPRLFLVWKPIFLREHLGKHFEV